MRDRGSLVFLARPGQRTREGKQIGGATHRNSRAFEEELHQRELQVVKLGKHLCLESDLHRAIADIVPLAGSKLFLYSGKKRPQLRPDHESAKYPPACHFSRVTSSSPTLPTGTIRATNTHLKSVVLGALTIR